MTTDDWGRLMAGHLRSLLWLRGDVENIQRAFGEFGLSKARQLCVILFPCSVVLCMVAAMSVFSFTCTLNSANFHTRQSCSVLFFFNLIIQGKKEFYQHCTKF